MSGSIYLHLSDAPHRVSAVCLTTHRVAPPPSAATGWVVALINHAENQSIQQSSAASALRSIDLMYVYVPEPIVRVALNLGYEVLYYLLRMILY